MTQKFSLPRAAALLGLLALGACGGGLGDTPSAPPVLTAPIAPPAVDAGEVIGEGAITVAMLLPISAGGSASGLAEAFKNAATLAMGDVEEDQIRIVVRDTGGDGETARAAAETAIADGAQAILGPVFAPAVAGASEPARAANVPVVAFSTDASVTGRGVYLLSFLPRQDAKRIVAFAARRGVRAFAGLVPENGYGLLMEAALREAVSSTGGRVTTVERYAPGGLDAAVAAIAARGAVEAVFVPNGGDDPTAAASALRTRGINARLLGSGQWDTSAVAQNPALSGAWFPGPSKGNFEAFARRFEVANGVAPPRTASLVYDATLLLNGLVATRGAAAFRRQALENTDGYIGLDGIFRLTRDGLSERGLAVYEVQNAGVRVIDPAPAQF
ncbi:MAG: penicillin-binding protein activator [Pseudomonadota bacterium]